MLPHSVLRFLTALGVVSAVPIYHQQPLFSPSAVDPHVSFQPSSQQQHQGYAYQAPPSSSRFYHSPSSRALNAYLSPPSTSEIPQQQLWNAPDPQIQNVLQYSQFVSQTSKIPDSTEIQQASSEVTDVDEITDPDVARLPRFFGELPHERALRNNLALRSSQGLPDLRLGSIRLNSPFFRG